MQTIPLQDDFFHGHISIEHRSDGGIQAWRLPFEDLTLHYPNVAERAGCPAGIRICLQTDADALSISCIAADEDRQFDCYIDGSLHSYATLAANEDTITFEALGPHQKLIEIWLTHKNHLIISSLATNDGAQVAPYVDKRLKWLTYGSSITQCGRAHSPSRTWPATAARQRNLNLTCMGFGGNCHLETMVGRCIRDQDYDLVTLKLGINVYGSGSLNERSYFPAVIGLVRLIRERHPQTPIGVITSIYSTDREENPNKAELTLKQYREQTAEAVRRLQEHGDTHIEIYNGLEMFGPEHVAMLPDHLHPDGDGYELLGNNISEKVLKPMLAKYFPNAQ